MEWKISVARKNKSIRVDLPLLLEKCNCLPLTQQPDFSLSIFPLGTTLEREYTLTLTILHASPHSFIHSCPLKIHLFKACCILGSVYIWRSKTQLPTFRILVWMEVWLEEKFILVWRKKCPSIYLLKFVCAYIWRATATTLEVKERVFPGEGHMASGSWSMNNVQGKQN